MIVISHLRQRLGILFTPRPLQIHAALHLQPLDWQRPLVLTRISDLLRLPCIADTGASKSLGVELSEANDIWTTGGNASGGKGRNASGGKGGNASGGPAGGCKCGGGKHVILNFTATAAAVARPASSEPHRLVTC